MNVFHAILTLIYFVLASTLASAQDQLQDGFYKVNAFCKQAVDCSAESNKETTLPLLDLSMEPAQTEGYVRLNTKFFVPIFLNEDPEKISDDRDPSRSKLMISLKKRSSKKLRRFTKKHLNGIVAIVIGNKAVTKHKIKSVITGGKVQITRCTDNACEVLFTELQDNR